MAGVSIWTLLELTYGIPSHIANTVEWLRWVQAIPINWQIAAAAVTCFVGVSLASWDWWRPKLSLARGHDEVAALSAWCAPDGSITLLQAAFLWTEIPVQKPIPLEVQDKLSMLQNAIGQGALSMHHRYGADAETFFAAMRFWAGNATPYDTRVLPAELKRWAETIGDVPGFLHCVEPFAPRNADELSDGAENDLS